MSVQCAPPTGLGDGGADEAQSELRQHFGLGNAAGPDAIEVRWPEGTRSTMSGVKANPIVRILQQPR